ncbi:MAG: linear amide C-N hydrolase [Ruminococcus sp.]|nr:linear amide C-N hydrolase [Ruminococcus sp.]
MCTAIYDNKNSLFGRTLDLEYSYNEAITITPRNFNFSPKIESPIKTKFTIMGMGIVAENFPLYFDAFNEKGLAVAALNFPKSACYYEPIPNHLNLAPFEIIPYILGVCQNIYEAKELLNSLNVCDISFSDEYKSTPLHWMIADQTESIVVESTESGLQIYENDLNVITNEPTFHYQTTYFKNFGRLSPFDEDEQYSRGLSSYGLPGDFSSTSRFVRAAYLLKNSITLNKTQFFKLLDNVSVPRGAIQLKNGENVITQYSCCMDLQNKIYYYKTYNNSRICGVHMPEKPSNTLIVFPIRKDEDILLENINE